jgi:hypothetical protein
VGIRAQKSTFIQLIQFQQKARNLTAAQADAFTLMVRRCNSLLDLARVKEVVHDVARGVTENVEVNLLVADPLDNLDEPEDPPRLREALQRSRVTFKRT